MKHNFMTELMEVKYETTARSWDEEDWGPDESGAPKSFLVDTPIFVRARGLNT